MTDKQIQEEELYKKEQEFIQNCAKQQVEIENQKQEYFTKTDEQVYLIKQEMESKILEINQGYEQQLREKEEVINKIKLIKSKLENEEQKNNEQDSKDKIQKLEKKVKKKKEKLEDVQKKYKSKIKDKKKDIESLRNELQQQIELSQNIIQLDQEIQCEIIVKNETFLTDSKLNNSISKKDLDLEQKYQLLKRKYKKQKEQTQKYEKDLIDIGGHVEQIEKKEKFRQQNLSQSESKIRDLEVQLSKASQNVKELQLQFNKVLTEKVTLESQLQSSNKQGDVMAEDVEELLEFKEEMSKLCDELKIQIQRKKSKINYLKENLEYKEQELQKKDAVLQRVSQTAEDAQKLQKQATLKLRQIEHTKLKDLKRKIAQQEQIIIDLSNKLKSQIVPVQDASRSPESRISAARRGNMKQNYGSQIKNSIERSANRKMKGSSNGPTFQDQYDRQVDSFVSRLKDPIYKNNSSSMQGVFGSGGGAIKAAQKYGEYHQTEPSHDEVNYESSIGGTGARGGLTSSRDDKIRRILESTEQYEKLQYFTPEKSQLPQKLSSNKRNTNLPSQNKDAKFRR
eukprot:403362377